MISFTRMIFDQVNEWQDAGPVYVNPDSIAYCLRAKNKQYTMIVFTGEDTTVNVKEGPDYVAASVNEWRKER